MTTSELRQRQTRDYDPLMISNKTEQEYSSEGGSCWGRFSQWIQDSCYQIMAYTVWDNVVVGFKPGRARAIELMEIEAEDHILFVGEGSGLDFECLPERTNKAALKAFDFSSEMVRQCKIKARQFDIPEENCFRGDAQYLPFTDEKFGKIYFPLSFASIPNPSLALKEAERVLTKGGKIVIFDKMVDKGVPITYLRKVLNIFTKCIFADINRDLSTYLHDVPDLKIVHYESLKGKLGGVFAKQLGRFYRIAVVVRDSDFPEQPAVQAKIQ